MLLCHRRVTNLALSALLATSPGIQRLSLYWNLNVTNDTLFAAAAQCPGLRALSLSGCKNVTDPGVRALARGCPGITALDLTRCSRIVCFCASARVGLVHCLRCRRCCRSAVAVGVFCLHTLPFNCHLPPAAMT